MFIQPTTYGLDNRCQLEPAAQLGDAARAAVVVNGITTDYELARLTSQGAIDHSHAERPTVAAVEAVQRSSSRE